MERKLEPLTFFFLQLTQAKRETPMDARLDGAALPTWDKLD